MKKLAIVTTHPIQYNAPWFQLLSERNKVEFKVFYTWSQTRDRVFDRTFGLEIKWDVPLLEGYEYEFVENVSKKPGSHHFFGIDNPSLINSLKMFQPDAILIFGWNFKSHLRVIRYFKGKVAIWFRGDSTLLDEIFGIKLFLRRTLLKWLYRHIDLAFYVGKANQAYFLKHGLLKNQLVYSPHAIDNERFFDTAERKYEERAKSWRLELGFSENDLVILFAGKFEPKKQPDLLLTSCIHANKSRKNPVKLLMVGNGPMEEELKKQAEGIDYIHFIPFQNQSNMPVVYRLGNVFCLPSKGPGETWGLAVNEAMACDRPVIVSDKVGCASDLIVDGKNGWIVNIKHPKNLTDLIEKLDVANLRAMGINSGNRIKSWNFEKIVNSIENRFEL